MQLPAGNIGFYASNGNPLSWTPDGRILFISNESGNTDVWLMDPDGKNRKQLTTGSGLNATPVASADGRLIHYSINQNNVTNIWSQSPEGGEPRQVTDFKSSVMTGFAWSRDGKQLACTRGVLARDAVLIADLGK